MQMRTGRGTSSTGGPDSGLAGSDHGARKSNRRRRLLPAAIVICAVLVGYLMMKTGPRSRRKPPARTAKLVEVSPIRVSEAPTSVEVMGTVLAARQITLTPRVSGQVVAASPEYQPGGLFREGDTVVRIDPADYRLIVQQRESALTKAEGAHRLEMGLQAVAVRDYELLNETIAEEDRDLVLRKPQLQSAEASVTSARAALEDARLDLARTRVRAPFNALLGDRFADVGSQVSAASPLGTLVGVDTFWVEASVPVDQLRWIEIPATALGKGATARVYNETAWGPTGHRSGRVIRMHAGLEPKGRMARLLIAVPDPLALNPENQGRPRMILSSYCRVEINGKTLADVASIPRTALRDGDRVFVMDASDRLEVRKVEVVFRGARAVLARGLREGERLVTTELSAPVPGMPLRIQSEGEPARGHGSGEAKGGTP